MASFEQGEAHISWLGFISGSHISFFSKVFSIFLCVCMHTPLSMCHCVKILLLLTVRSKRTIDALWSCQTPNVMENLLLCNRFHSSYVPGKEVNSCWLLCPKGRKKWRRFNSTSHHVGRGQKPDFKINV